MKTIATRFILFYAFALVLLPRLASAQTITINSVSGTSFCSGDPVSVTFTVTGFWGHRNAFTLQLSDPSGSFSGGFQNLGSLVDTLPGTFTITTTIPGGSSTHYRFRILAAIPYTTSADNGSDIAIGSRIWNNYLSYQGPDVASTGTPITFSLATDPENKDNFSGIWDFGSGASPASVPFNISGPMAVSSTSVTYSTPGHKITTITLSGGCAATATLELDVYDCSIPAIPHDAIVINSDMVDVNRGIYWVNPGFTLTSPNYDTIFAEPGSTISGAISCLIYMKSGSVFNNSIGSNRVIFGDSVSISASKHHDFTLNCPTLDFDYTNAPPNAAHPLEGVVNISLPSLTISPNPTNGNISINGLPPNVLDISIMNLLGETEMKIAKPNSPDLQIDLGKLSHGVYYVRFAMPGAVVTKKIVKE
jgi:hypothetical protein